MTFAAGPAAERRAGAVLAAFVVLSVFGLSGGLLYLAARLSPVLLLVVSVAMASTALAARSLGDAAQAVLSRLEAGDIGGARKEVAMIVGRDTENLDEQGIIRATVESVAEKASDGVIAPLFYLALGGPALAMAYKAVNTLDSMVGYRSARYLHFGRASALLDDLANFVPARVTAVLICLSSAAIVADRAKPTFENTIAALDRSGRRLARVEHLFFNLTSSETSPALQAVERELAPRLAAHESDIFLDAALFARIYLLHARRDALALDDEQRRLLERIHPDFVLAGAKLGDEAKARWAQIVERLAHLLTAFSQNVLADESNRVLWLRSEGDLAGLPASVRAAAKGAAVERGEPDAWAITTSRSLVVPFLTFSDRRDLRQQAYTAWKGRGESWRENEERFHGSIFHELQKGGPHRK